MCGQSGKKQKIIPKLSICSEKTNETNINKFEKSFKNVLKSVYKIIFQDFVVEQPAFILDLTDTGRNV